MAGLRAGIVSGLQSGIVSGLQFDASAGEVLPLLELDFTQPEQPALLDQYNRASIAAPITGSDAGGVVVQKFASGAYAYANADTFLHAAATVPENYNRVADSEGDYLGLFCTDEGFVTDPEGDTDAKEYTFTSGTAAIRAAGGAQLIGAGTYTVSVWVKRGASESEDVLFNIRDASANFGISSTFAATDAWQRFTFTDTFTTANTLPELRSAYVPATDIIGKALQVFGWQINPGASASAYVETTGTALTVVEHTGKLGALIERAATNLIPYSEEFDNAAWSKTGATVNANAAVAPDGTPTADEVVFSGTTRNIGDGIVVTSGNNYVMSVFMKSAAGATTVNLTDPQSGTLETKNLTTEWQRFSLPFVGAGSNSAVLRIESLSNQTIEVWGAQIEADVLTSYIPTSGATASRVLTEAIVTTPLAKGFIDYAQGEVQIDHVFRAYPADGGAPTGSEVLLAFRSDGPPADDSRWIRYDNAATLASRVYPNSATDVGRATTFDPDEQVEYRHALQWDSAAGLDDARELQAIVNEVVYGGSTGGYTPSAVEHDLQIGGYLSNAANQCNTTVARVRVWQQPQAVDPVLLALDFTQVSQPAELDTFNRASVTAPVTGVGASGVQVTKFASDEYAYAYNENFSHANKRAMAVEPAATNLAAFSEDLESQANPGNATITTDQATAPDGTATADEVQFDDASLSYVSTFRNSTAVDDYTFSVFLRAKEGTADVTLRIETGTGGADIVDLDVTLTEQWARYEVTKNHGSVTTLRTYIRNNAGVTGNNVYVWGYQIETGTVATSYIPTSGATASRVDTYWQVSDLLANGYLAHDFGELRATYVCPRPNASEYFAVFVECPTNADDKRIVTNGTNSTRLYREDEGLIFAQTLPIPTQDAEETVGLQWARDSRIDGSRSVRMLKDGVVVGSPTSSAFTAGRSPCDLIARPTPHYFLSALTIYSEPVESVGIDEGFDEGFG